MKQRGFTLVEILVVIAIIALLAAIVGAALWSGRGRAKETACISNLRQLYLATNIYRQDYDGADPEIGKRMTCKELGTPCSVESYMGLLHNYVKNKEVLICPAFPRVQKPECTYFEYLFGNVIPDFVLEHEDKIKLAYERDQKVLERLGSQVPMFMCPDFHNPPIESWRAPRDATKRVILIRYNGSAVTVITSVRSQWPYEEVTP